MTLPCDAQVPPGSNSYGWVSKLSGADGSCLWTHVFPGFATGVAVDPASNVYVAGDLQGSLPFAGTTLTLVGSSDVLLLAYDGSGSERWGRSWGSLSRSQFTGGLAVAPDGRVWISGAFAGSITLGAQTFGPTPGETEEMFVAGLTPGGAVVSATAFTSTRNYAVSGGPYIRVDHQGALVVAGTYVGNLTIGGTVLTAQDPSALDMFAAKLDPTTLAPLWAHGFGDGVSHLEAVAVDDCDEVLLTGGFTGPVNLGCGPKPAAGLGFFLARLGP